MKAEEQLIILPFDHRGSFLKKMFGIEGEPTFEEAARVKDFKSVVYEGFKQAVFEANIPKAFAGILVDEQFGDLIIKDAKESGFVVAVCAEKSGQEEFEFEYRDFGEHIRKYSPDYVKALVRYNPDGDRELNERQAEKLKQLSDFCHSEDYRLMLEPLVVPTEKQLAVVDNDMYVYDTEMRPKLMELMIEELQSAGVEPDIWKIEGLEEGGDYQMLVDQVRYQGRNSSIIILGRNAEDEQIEKWLSAGSKIEGVVGFAVGRTVFGEPLMKYRDGYISREQAVYDIAKKFMHFYEFFEMSKKL